MAQFTYLYPYFGSYQGSVIYYKSTFTTSNQYFILVNDQKLFKRTGIRVATFTYDQHDDRYGNPVVRYGNTSSKTILPNKRFEESIIHAIQLHEGTAKVTSNEKQWLHRMHNRLDQLSKRIFEYPRKKRFGNQ